MPNSSGKLYYLKDRPRKGVRRGVDSGSTVSPDVPVDNETRWLARCLFAEAGYLLLSWVVLTIGYATTIGGGEEQSWLYSFLPADLFLAGVLGAGAVELLRRGPRAQALLLFGAGALVSLSIVRLFHGIGFAADPTIGERFQTLAVFAAFFVGSWTAMHAFRMRREN